MDASNAQIQALGPLGFVTDTFTYQVMDRGQLVDTAQINVLIRGQNEPPVAQPDTGQAVEAGGQANGTTGVDPSGNVLTNDTDVEDDALSVSGVRTGPAAGSGTAGTLSQALRGQYGDLTLNADGSWSYAVDNTLADVQALRATGQTLTDVFSYTLEDAWGGTDTGELQIVIDGRNDTPQAQDDTATAIEAGGIANATPGTDPGGNVLTNDTDVDSTANGETRQVLSVLNFANGLASAGQALAGRYGTLTLRADGSYDYAVDNANPEVEALRTAGQTLTEVFVYRMADTAGATSEARLTIQIQGANDTPAAQDDEPVATDQVPAPQAVGNVLPNDADVDAGDTKRVIDIRTGPEQGAGTAGTLGQSLAGQYGTLVLQADGSYTYTLDLTNPEVLAAAGLGQVLQDVFTYTMEDATGATDRAQLVVHLDISAPYIPPGGEGEHHVGDEQEYFGGTVAWPDVQPIVYIEPVIDVQSTLQGIAMWRVDGSNIEAARSMPLHAQSLNPDLHLVPGQFVHAAVRQSRFASELDMDWVLGRHGRVSLTADGLLPDPSLFAANADALDAGLPQRAPAGGPAARADTATGFSEQLRAAARKQAGPPGGPPAPRPPVR